MALELFLKGSLISSGILVIYLLYYERSKLKIREENLSWIIRIQALFISGALISLFYYFYIPDFNINYVFSKVSLDTPLIYRLSAVWIGQEGVFLVWAWTVAICALFFFETRVARDSFSRRTLLTVAILIFFFTGLATMMDPFKPTLERFAEDAARSGSLLDEALINLDANKFYNSDKGFIEGMGMSPILMSPWMALHPPIVFIAYSLASIPFGICLIYFIEGKGKWETGSRPWARLSWIFLTSGLIIGSFWAYEELSFGSYWTWDPIETASLIPWITLTMFLHGSYEYRRKGAFGIITPTMGVLTTILIIFGTFITKSGLIESSHAYEKSSITPVLILGITLSVTTLSLSAGRFYLKNKKPLKLGKPLVTTTNIFYLSMILFAILLGILLWGVAYPLFAKVTYDKTISIGKAFYNNRGYPFAAATMLLSGFCLLLWVLKKNSVIAVSAGVIGMSALGFMFKPTGSIFVDTFIPIGTFVITSTILRVKKELANSKKGIEIVRAVGGHIVHLGIALMLIGVVASGSLQKGRDIIFNYPQERDVLKDAGSGYEIRLKSLFVYQDDSGNWVQEANTTVFKDGREIEEIVLTLVNDRRFGVYPEVSIIRGFSSDFYAVFYGVSGMHEEGGALIPVNVRVNPYVSFVWGGSIIAVIAAFSIFAIELFYSKS